jgi:hypothetical protein
MASGRRKRPQSEKKKRKRKNLTEAKTDSKNKILPKVAGLSFISTPI